MAKINLRVDPEIMRSMITVDDYLGMQEGDIAASVNVLSKFVIGEDDELLSYEEGRKVIGLIPMEELPGVMDEFSKAIQDAASPPE
jgi:hypothetical protein